MTLYEESLLDQEIIVKALYILGEIIKEPSDFITKEMLDRLPQLKKQEQFKLVLLEKEKNNGQKNKEY